MSLFSQEHLRTIPLKLHSFVKQCEGALEKTDVADFSGLKERADFLEALARLVAFSDYAAFLLHTHPEYIIDVYQKLHQPLSKEQLVHDLKQRLTGADESLAMRVLRQFRHQASLRILWRFVLNESREVDHFNELSLVADVILQVSTHWQTEQLAQVYGLPFADGVVQEFIIIALGKLGGYELNFSSDVDLVFCFTEHGQTEGASLSISNENFFLRLAQALLKLLSDTTEDGFVFRVDLRLRPHGNAGPLVMSYQALEQYYQIHGRDWERYALVKMRPLTGSDNAKQELLTLLKPFVYRRYLDFTAFHALHEMKAKVQLEVKRKKLELNVKRGPGGIRQIEFIAQMFQIIRAGKSPQLQLQNLLKSLSLIHEEQLITETVYQHLKEGYLFLRHSEHCLQMIRDEQTHDLPSDETTQIRLAWMMGFNSYDRYFKKYEKITSRVQLFFDKISTPSPGKVSGPVHTPLGLLWDRVHDADYEKQIVSIEGVTETFIQALRHFKNERAVKNLRQQAMNRLNSFMPKLLDQLLPFEAKEDMMIEILALLRKILRRSSYILLLNDNPKALKRLVKIASKSTWVIRLIASYPLLLDELLSPISRDDILSKDFLYQSLQDSLKYEPADLDEQMERLRQFKLVYTLKIAVKEVTSLSFDAGLALTYLAAVILKKVFEYAWTYVVSKNTDYASMNPEYMAVIAYGNFGGYDLHYESDLDLVFVYLDLESNPDVYLRVAQRMIHMLSTQTLTGKLYDVDVRLRPGGNAGLLVSPLKAFAKYLQDSAWTWEHQALVRARLLLGGPLFLSSFNELRQAVLSKDRSVETLRFEIQEMRAKLYSHRVNDAQSDFKKTPGGLTDIEFLTQFYVLKVAKTYPAILNVTRTRVLLEILHDLKILSSDAFEGLIQALLVYQRETRVRLLQCERVVLPDFQPYFSQVLTEWNATFSSSGR